jgi:hypothetical protein
VYGLRLACGVMVLALSGCSERTGPPRGWQESLELEELEEACEPLIGKAGRIVSRPDFDFDVVVADVVALDGDTVEIELPSAILRYQPLEVSISPVDVDVRLGSFRHRTGERDWWGVVCSRGDFRGTFLRLDRSTYLERLSRHLWYYDGIM